MKFHRLLLASEPFHFLVLQYFLYSLHSTFSSNDIILLSVFACDTFNQSKSCHFCRLDSAYNFLVMARKLICLYAAYHAKAFDQITWLKANAVIGHRKQQRVADKHGLWRRRWAVDASDTGVVLPKEYPSQSTSSPEMSTTSATCQHASTMAMGWRPDDGLLCHREPTSVRTTYKWR